MKKPSIGRIVHLYTHNAEIIPAIITKVMGNHVNLFIFGYSRTSNLSVPYSETYQTGHWTWPPYDVAPGDEAVDEPERTTEPVAGSSPPPEEPPSPAEASTS